MKKMFNLGDVGFLLLLGICVSFILFEYMPIKQKMKRDAERQADHNKLELVEQGGGMLYTPPDWDVEKDGKYFNYMIHSWDGGKSWYVTEYDKNCVNDQWGIRILGDVNEMYPGLLEHIKSMEQLSKYVEDNGSISADDPLGIDALENAGFEVKLDIAK